jgi:hypothetical protein
VAAAGVYAKRSDKTHDPSTRKVLKLSDNYGSTLGILILRTPSHYSLGIMERTQGAGQECRNRADYSLSGIIQRIH